MSNIYDVGLDLEALSFHSQELKDSVTRELNKGKETPYDFKVDIHAYINMERNNIKQMGIRRSSDSSVLLFANVINKTVELFNKADNQMAKDMEDINEL